MRPGIDLDVLEAVQMLWRWLDYGKKQLARPVGGSVALDLARQILQLRLEPANKEGFRWWRLRVGAEERLLRAGLDPGTGNLISPDAWQSAVERALAELGNRKARRALHKSKLRAQIIDAQKEVAVNILPRALERLAANGELSPAVDDSIRQSIEPGELSFGRNVVTPSAFEIDTRKEPPASGPPHKRRRPSW